jgi:hypothetical protein
LHNAGKFKGFDCPTNLDGTTIEEPRQLSHVRCTEPANRDKCVGAKLGAE